jgi:bacteriocin biosynthesis cyclodehydratase domain-containing protein
MILRLDPSFPRVWRDPTTLQFGVEAPKVVLEDLSLAEERVVHSLVTGTTSAALSITAQRVGLRPGSVDDLMRRIAPVLLAPASESTSPAPPAPVVLVIGRGAAADTICATLSAVDLSVLRGSTADAAESTPCDFAVATGHFVLDPRLRSIWLRRDVPHLPIIFTEASVRVGPIIEPGAGPCLHCIERHAIDADPAWPAIASQLLGRGGGAEHPLLAIEAAACASRAVIDRVRHGIRFDRAARVTAATGRVSLEKVVPHPDCGCLAPQGNGWVSVASEPAHSIAPAPAPPTKETATAELG